MLTFEEAVDVASPRYCLGTVNLLIDQLRCVYLVDVPIVEFVESSASYDRLI